MAVYSDTHKILFVHVPKTGGTSIQNWLINNANGRPLKKVKHWPYYNIIEKYNNLEIKKSFAVVRNPWDYVVSWYFFTKDRAERRLTQGTTKNKGKFSKEYNQYVLDEFAKGFDHYVEKLNPKQQYERVQGIDNIFKLENLQQEFTIIQNFVECSLPLGFDNISNRKKNYKQYYSENSKQIIAEKFAIDIATFGYKF